MRRLLAGAACALAGCGWSPPCPTVAYTAGSVHSLTVAVAESLLTDEGGPRRGSVCFRLDGLASYEQVDQPDAEVALAERIAADRSVVAVVGQSGSTGSLAAAPVYARAGIPQIVPTATTTLLRVAGPWTFVLAPPESTQARFLAAALDSLRASRVTLVYAGESYGEGLEAAMRPALSARGLRLVDEVRLGDDADVATLTEASLHTHPTDAMVILGYYTEAAQVAKVVVARAPRVRLLAADGAYYPTGLRRVGGAAAESLAIVSFWRPDPHDAVDEHFVARFRQLAGRDPTPSEALGVDALLFARAAILARGPDRSGVRAWLAGPGGATPPPGHISDNTLHDGRSSRLALLRIGPLTARPPH
ncbi:MAG TPA: ABC transporter substrate-binding protein [Gemmatimonadales bacterium]|nr:ABC transporter substrate-binding protein [Gemmatimonadales bacterium]